MHLTHEQKRSIFQDGFAVIPGVVPPVMIDSALKAINHSLGGQGIDPEKLPTLRAQSYCPEIQRSPEIAGLINATPAWALAESVLGEGTLSPVTGGQIALRFPGLQDPPGTPRPHLDGMYSPTNGMKEGTIGTFTALAGIFLSDVSSPGKGNFTVWPGTHRLNEAYFREHSPTILLEGMPKVGLPEPLQVTGRAGDMVIAHYLLSHSASPNVSPHVRYTCFYRLRYLDHDEHGLETMTDMWRQWPGIREAFAG